MKRFGVRKVKTWDGLKWGVVDLTTKSIFHIGNKGESILTYKSTDIDVVEYKENKLDQIALFPLTKEGLLKAKQVQLSLNK